MNKRICKISLFSMILACVATVPGESAIKAKNSANRSYAGAYQQINAMRYEQEYMNANAQTATTASATDNLPVAVDDEKLANAIVNNDSSAPAMSKLESCAMIYPNGTFKWGEPESGVRKNPGAQCMAVIELRDANTNLVLATTTVGAGDSMKCNIDYFPQSGYNLAALSNVELPADAAPTVEDVESVMNEEQKQNAGLKIVAAALIGGVGGNLLAPKTKKKSGDSDTKLPLGLGTGETQLKDTAIGAVTGAGIMAASTYTGKVAGDTIKSTAVNAASGMIVGNMLAGTSGVGGIIATTKCSVNGTEKDCVVGNIVGVGEQVPTTQDDYYIISKDGKEVIHCADNSCKTIYETLTNIKLDVSNGNSVPFEERNENISRITPCAKTSGDGNDEIKYECKPGLSNAYYKIASANKTKGSSQHAYAVFDNLPNKLTGYTAEEFNKLTITPTYYYRYGDGSVGNKVESTESEKIKFEPSMRDADDGGLIDLSNAARVKGTVAGGAVGGALGGVAGYSGAKGEVADRWTAAIREYEDSLSNFVCITGGRYLSKYNDYVEIPELSENNQ